MLLPLSLSMADSTTELMVQQYALNSFPYHGVKHDRAGQCSGFGSMLLPLSLSMEDSTTELGSARGFSSMLWTLSLSMADSTTKLVRDRGLAVCSYLFPLAWKTAGQSWAVLVGRCEPGCAHYQTRSSYISKKKHKLKTNFGWKNYAFIEFISLDNSLLLLD